MSMFNEDALALREEIDITRRTLVQNLDDFKISREALEKEIASLKELVVQAIPYVEYAVTYSTPLSQKRSEEWLEKTQARIEK